MKVNKTVLLGHYGNDLTHALSAWTSTYRELDKKKLNRVDKLLAFLAEEGHDTPFEKSVLHFLVTVDQATHIHLLKHRIGVSINGESARYKELKEDKLIIPEDWKSLKIDNPDEKFKDLDYLKGNSWAEVLEEFSKLGNQLYHLSLEDLTPILGRKRAKESARFFKTFNSQIDLDISFNWRSFNHFQKLRNAEDAQKEVRDIAQDMLELVKNIEGNPFKHTIKAFGL